MLVEFADIEDRDKLVPTATNMTVETMPNDNLVCLVSNIFPELIINVSSCLAERSHSMSHFL